MLYRFSKGTTLNTDLYEVRIINSERKNFENNPHFQIIFLKYFRYASFSPANISPHWLGSYRDY